MAPRRGSTRGSRRPAGPRSFDGAMVPARPRTARRMPTARLPMATRSSPRSRATAAAAPMWSPTPTPTSVPTKGCSRRRPRGMRRRLRLLLRGEGCGARSSGFRDPSRSIHLRSRRSRATSFPGARSHCVEPPQGAAARCRAARRRPLPTWGRARYQPGGMRRGPGPLSGDRAPTRRVRPGVVGRWNIDGADLAPATSRIGRRDEIAPARRGDAARCATERFEAVLRREPPRCCPGESPVNRTPATRQGHLSRRLHRLP